MSDPLLADLDVIILDYGAGNLRSVVRAVERVGARPEVASVPAALDEGSLSAILDEDGDYRRMSSSEQAVFRDRIDEIRRTGISTAVDESFIGLHDTAVLIGNPAIGVTAALAITQLTASRKSGETQQVIDALLRCAQQINQRAGLTNFAEQPVPAY